MAEALAGAAPGEWRWGSSIAEGEDDPQDSSADEQASAAGENIAAEEIGRESWRERV